MRPLYRIWDKDEKIYREDLFVDTDGWICYKLNHEVECQDNYIIELCTGLKDKNDNWIYEGDTVVYQDTISAFPDTTTILYDDTKGWFSPPKYIILWYEVIGNVHDKDGDEQ